MDGIRRYGMPTGGISYAFNPILPYMAGAVFAKVVQVFTDSFRATVIAARMVNVLWDAEWHGLPGR